VSLLTDFYGTAAGWRRRWYASHPASRQRLARPVISIGSLAFGGRAKTPTCEHVARVLVGAGERPAILSRGYGRTRPVDGAVVVRDHLRIKADLARSGDEPLMLAQSLDGAVIVVSPDRYLGGRLAELRLGATVHILDDGFQHVRLERDVEILLVRGDDLLARPSRPAAAEPLRENAEAARAADALIAIDGESPFVPLRAGQHVFQLARKRDAARLLEPAGERLPRTARRVVAVAGIARPERFFDDLRAGGWDVAAELRFADHHAFTSRDVDRIASRWRETGADAVVTTEKDAVRLLPFRPMRMPMAVLPLTVRIEPAESFQDWLKLRLAGRRSPVS
jgi:tetraacyldisaccharide 4'-kinase